MIPRVLTLDQLSRVVPSLIADKSVVALVSDPPDDAWGVQSAWAVARAAATKQRVALVDASLEQPGLDQGAKDPVGKGLVDAFEFGSPLEQVAQNQGGGLFYIPVGTTPSDPAAIRRSDRWERLQRGFAAEHAILLLYAPSHALAELSLQPDAVVVLAEHGVTGEHPAAAIAPVIGVLQGTPFTPASRTALRIPWRQLLIGASAVIGTVGLVLLVLLLLPAPEPDLEAPGAPAPPADGPAEVADGPVVVEEDPPVAAAATPAPDRPLDEPTGDTLFYVVQVAAFNRLNQATDLVNELSAAGFTGFVTPVLVGQAPTRWYRVVAGALPSPHAADSVREALWGEGLLERGQGVILRTPDAYQLVLLPSENEARVVARGLRERGLPAYIVAGANGPARVLLGAFENPEQARAADSLLAAFGLQGTLVTRIGRPR